MRSGPSGRRSAGAALLALAALVAAVVVSQSATVRSDDRPNVIVVLTDDQRAGTFAQMPWLGSQLARAASGWTAFPNAFANTPLCCPARASLLTGLYARHTGVLDNGDGDRLDASATLATWLHDAGYRTGLVGKYLNTYPFGRPPFIPPGWDRFVAKENQTGVTVYRDFHAVDQGSPVFVRRYATDWLAERAIDFVRTAPPTQPFFLLFAPSAPHPPWIPAARHEGAFAGLRVEEPPTVAGALRGAPPWVRSLPFPSAAQRAAWLDDQRRADETLLAVDEALRRYRDHARRSSRRHGDLRAVGQRVLVRRASVGRQDVPVRRLCPHPAGRVHARRARRPRGCVRLDRGSRPHDPRPRGCSAGRGEGRDELRRETGCVRRVPDGRPDPVFLEWAGDDRIPAWRSVRTADFTLIRYADGFEELYDLRGRLGPADPWESINLARDPRAAGVAQRLRTLLGRVLGPD